MKIRQKRQLNLHELIKWAWENDKNKFFKSVNEEEVRVYICRGSVSTEAGNERPSADALFEIEEEVEITEDMKFGSLFAQVEKGEYEGLLNQIDVYENCSIKDLLTNHGLGRIEFKFIYLQNEDGSIGELIWKDGQMV